jgi:hypothetical protein
MRVMMVRDDDGRDRTNEGTPTVQMRMETRGKG